MTVDDEATPNIAEHLQEIVDKVSKLMTRHYGIDKDSSSSERNKEFLYSLMKNDKKKSEELWLQQEDKILAALYARALLRAKGKKSTKSKEERNPLAKEFEKKAMDLLEKCQDDNEEMSKELLLKSCESWGGLNCIALAVKTRFKKFLAMKSAHLAVSEIWNGDIVCHSSSFWFWVRLYLAVLFPPMLFSLDYQSVSRQRSEDTPTDETIAKEDFSCGKRCCWPGLQKICSFYRAPTIAFRLNVISYVIFLGLYSYMVLVELGEKIQWSEILIYVWLITMVLGEINEAYVDNRYVSSTWNLVDVLCLIIFITGAIIRPIYCNGCVDIVRVIYAIDLIIFCARFLHILTVNKLLGPKLVMIKFMFMDLFGFFVILITIVYGYAVASEAILYPNSRLTWRLPYFLARKAYFQIFGELFLDDIEGSENCSKNTTLYRDSDIPRCPSEIGTLLVPVLLGVYILLTNVLLLNLLIAMFSYTINRIQKAEKEHWNLERARLVLEYKSGPAFPPPLNVLCILYGFLRRKCSQPDKGRYVGSKLQTFQKTSHRSGQKSGQLTMIKQEMEAFRTKLDQLINNWDDLTSSSGKPKDENRPSVELEKDQSSSEITMGSEA